MSCCTRRKRARNFLRKELHCRKAAVTADSDGRAEARCDPTARAAPGSQARFLCALMALEATARSLEHQSPCEDAGSYRQISLLLGHRTIERSKAASRSVVGGVSWGLQLIGNPARGA